MDADGKSEEVLSDRELFPLQPATERYLALLEETFKNNLAAIEHLVRGNILLHIKPGGHVRHIVCLGRGKGFHHEATDDPVDFLLSIEEWLMLAMMSPDWEEGMMDFDRYRSEGAFHTEGDGSIYERFLALVDKKKANVLSIRSG